MYFEDEQLAQSCENEYQFRLGVLGGTLRRALVHIEADIRRPAWRKVIAIVTTV